MNHKINWVNDHTQICDRLHERVQLMQDFDGKPNDFDGIQTVPATKPASRSRGTAVDRIMLDALPASCP